MKKRNWGCRLESDLLVCGYRAIVLENPFLRVGVLVDKGTDIVELLYKPRDLDLMAATPNGLRKKGEVASSAGSTGFFFDNYEGGWQEILPSAGPPCQYRGAEFGQHGEICLLPWEFQVLEDEESRVAVRFQVDCLRMPLRVEKTLTLQKDDPTLQVEETVTNLSPVSLDFMWGHHPAYGYPLIQGAQILLDECEIRVPENRNFQEQKLLPGFKGSWPWARGVKGEKLDLSLIPPATSKSADFCFLYPERGRYGIRNPGLSVECWVEWSLQTLRRLWFWQVCQGGLDWPWWGRLYCQALEPHSSAAWSLTEAIRAGEALTIAGGESRDLSLSITIRETV